jgi:hypothetical protein
MRWDDLGTCTTLESNKSHFCMWFNGQLGRPLLAFTDLVDW